MRTHRDPDYRSDLRSLKLAERDNLPAGIRFDASTRICSELFRLDQVRDAQTVFVYMHFRSEVQTDEFISNCLRLGKTVTIPYTVVNERRLMAVRVTDLERNIEPGSYGIPEPVAPLLQTAVLDPGHVDIAVIPGSVFDRYGGRLGYGGGYYDRFLVYDAARAFRIGLAFDIQVVEKVPVQSHDQLMDLVVTEKHIYDCRRNRDAEDGSIPR